MIRADGEVIEGARGEQAIASWLGIKLPAQVGETKGAPPAAVGVSMKGGS
jgi:hypothetical protein